MRKRGFLHFSAQCTELMTCAGDVRVVMAMNNKSKLFY